MRQSIRDINRRVPGEPRKFRGENPHFRLVCTSCGHEATVMGRGAASKWIAGHKVQHMNPVLIRQELIPT